VSSERKRVPPYSLPASSGTYFETGSSIEAILPSETAMPISIAVTVFAIDWETKRSWSVRPYW
jgi:hypothetical protein